MDYTVHMAKQEVRVDSFNVVQGSIIVLGLHQIPSWQGDRFMEMPLASSCHQ